MNDDEMSVREAINWLKRHRLRGIRNIETGQHVFITDPDQHGRHTFIVEYQDILQNEYNTIDFIQHFNKAIFIPLR